MNILFYTTFANQRELLKFIKKKFKGVKVFTIKDKVNLKKIEIAMVFNLPNSYFKKLVNLKLIFSLGAGVDHILNSPNYNNKIPIIRMKDPNMRKRMFNSIMAGSKGGKPGQWSARKAQLLASRYKKAGGGYK